MRKLTEWEENFFSVLEEMTAEEYQEVIRGMSVSTSPSKEGYITYIPQLTPGAEAEPNPEAASVQAKKVYKSVGLP